MFLDISLTPLVWSLECLFSPPMAGPRQFTPEPWEVAACDWWIFWHLRWDKLPAAALIGCRPQHLASHHKPVLCLYWALQSPLATLLETGYMYPPLHQPFSLFVRCVAWCHDSVLCITNITDNIVPLISWSKWRFYAQETRYQKL